MIEFVANASEAFPRHIAQVTLLILIVGTITRLLCRDRPYWALALWTVALIKCVVPPLVHRPYGMFCWIDSVTPSPLRSTRLLRISTVDAGPTGLAVTIPQLNAKIRLGRASGKANVYISIGRSVGSKTQPNLDRRCRIPIPHRWYPSPVDLDGNRLR